MEDDKYKVFNGRDLDKKYDRVVDMTIEQFKNGVLDGSLAYEVILSEMVPIYDRDHKLPGANAKELADADQAILTEGIAALRAVWGPEAIIHSFTSTGIKRSFDRDGYNGPFVSHRHIVRGVGKFESGAELKRSGRVPAMFDSSIYVSKGGQKLMRVWGGSKAGEDRPMKYYLHGKPKTLEEVNTENSVVANIMLMGSLAQYVGREPLIVVPGAEPVVSLTEEKTGRIVALGGNGEPLGEDVKITSVKQIRDLCVIAGKFQEVNRDHATYFPLIFEICNVGMDNDLDMTEMRALAHEVAAVCPNNDPLDVDKLFNKTMTRRKDQTRKHLGCLRGEARQKNEGAYLLWYESVKVLKVDRERPKDNTTETKTEPRAPYLFKDHNAFVGTITRKTADEWLADAIVMVMNGGESYFLTRNTKVCEITNRPFEVWRNIKSDKLMQTLDISVKIKNEHYDSKIAEAYVKKMAAGEHVTDEERKAFQEFSFFTFGPNKTINKVVLPGYVTTQIYKRNLRWVDHEDFIPFLARRIPDPDIKRAVLDKSIFNKFRGFPIEEEIYQPEGPKFLGSAWHTHLMNGICHGDMNEWKHLEATIADMIQRPYRLSNVAHVFQGKQGTGKSFLHKFMSELLGAVHTMLITDMSIYTQKFNEDQGLAILKVFEEVRGKGDQFINNDRLKADITKPIIRVEIKNGAILTLRHCARYWMLTNHRDTLHIEADDRRYVYHSVSAEHANDKEYFAPIVAELKERAYLRACLEYFAELPYDEMFVMTAITTVYKNEQKIDSMPLPLKFLQDVIELDILANADPLRKDGEKVNGVLMHELYDTWCAKNRHQQGSSKHLYKGFKLIDLVQKPMRIHGVGSKGLVINAIDLRDRFRAHFKMPNFDWEL